MTCFLILFFTALAGVLTFLSVRRYRAGTINRRRFLFECFFHACLMLMGVAFITHTHYMKYSFLHIMLVSVCVLLPFYVPARYGRAFVIILTAVIGFFTLFKFTYISRYGMPVYQTLPLNLCNLVAVMIIIRPLWKNELFDNYILCFGLLGGIMNTILGTRYGFDQNFYTDIVYESNIIHNLFLTYALYMLKSGEIIPDIRCAVQNLLWLVPVFGVFVFTNQIYQFNFFFTSKYENPILAIYQLFPTFDTTLGGFVFEINLPYYLIMITLSGLILYALAFCLVKITKHTGGNR